jgi:hypothetical protein
MATGSGAVHIKGGKVPQETQRLYYRLPVTVVRFSGDVATTARLEGRRTRSLHASIWRFEERETRGGGLNQVTNRSEAAGGRRGSLSVNPGKAALPPESPLMGQPSSAAPRCDIFREERMRYNPSAHHRTFGIVACAAAATIATCGSRSARPRSARRRAGLRSDGGEACGTAMRSPRPEVFPSDSGGKARPDCA